ncbi:MAG TPA: hypothetical protein VF401_03640 [Candidatus Saccharimonadales bacterium]
MSSKRLYYVLIGSICLLLVALIAGTYGTNKLLTSRASTLTGLKAKDQALNQEQTSLIKAKKDLSTYTDLQKIADAVVPEDKNQAEAVRQIVNIADDNSVTLANVTFPASTLGSGAIGSSAKPSTSLNSKANGLSQLTPVKNIPGVYELPITITGDPTKPVPYDQFINFLSDLEHNRRTAQVGNISIAPSATDRNRVSFSLSLNEYIKP